MSSKVRVQALRAGDTTRVTNDANKPLSVVFQSSTGSRISTILPLGATIEFSLGQESGRLFLHEQQAFPERLRLVIKGE